MSQDQIFYVGQKAFISKGGEVLILMLPSGMLDFPGGKIQIGETDLDTSIKREVEEETGLDIEVGEPFHRWCFEFPSNHSKAGHKVFLVGLKCEYKGGTIELSREHTDYKWVNKDNFHELKEDRGHYKALEAYFRTL